MTEHPDRKPGHLYVVLSVNRDPARRYLEFDRTEGHRGKECEPKWITERDGYRLLEFPDPEAHEQVIHGLQRVAASVSGGLDAEAHAKYLIRAAREELAKVGRDPLADIKPLAPAVSPEAHAAALERIEELSAYIDAESAKALDSDLSTAEVLLNADERITHLEAERDDLKGILATTADRLNTALRECGTSEMIGDPYHSLAIRDGVVALYDKGARYRTALAATQAEVKRLRKAIHVTPGEDAVAVARATREELQTCAEEADAANAKVAALEAERDALFTLKVDIGKALGGDDPRPFVERVLEMKRSLAAALDALEFYAQGLNFDGDGSVIPDEDDGDENGDFGRRARAVLTANNRSPR